MLLAALWSMFAAAGPAGAHAVVTGSSPPPGALLDGAPDQVALQFSEPVTVESFHVIDETGSVVGSAPEGAGAVVVADLPDDARGWHAVSWRVVSADGHPISGAWTFRVGEGSAAPPDDLTDRAEAAARISSGVRWTWLLAQGLSSLATVLVVGTLFLGLAGIAVTTPGRRLVVGAGGVALVASLWAAAANGPFSSSGTILDTVFTGPASGPYLIRGALVAVATLAAAVSGLRGRAAFAAIWLVAVAALSLPVVVTGHAPADGAATAAVVAAHLVVAACWLGAVPGLLLALRDGGSSGWELAGRFSLAAGRLLAAVVVFGAAGAWLLSGGIDEVRPTWGGLLVLKLAFVAVAGAAGSWNRWRGLPQTGAGKPAGEVLRRSLALEVGALVAVVATSVALTYNGPPSELAEAGPDVLDLEVTEEVRVELVVDPGRTGTNWVHVYTRDEAGLPVGVEEVTVTAQAPSLGIEPIALALTDVGGGHLVGIVDDFGLAGAWELRAAVRLDRFTAGEASGTVTIQ